MQAIDVTVIKERGKYTQEKTASACDVSILLFIDHLAATCVPALPPRLLRPRVSRGENPKMGPVSMPGTGKA